MTTPIQLRDQVVADLKTVFPNIRRRIEGHDGRIDVAAVERWVRTRQGIRVAVLGARRVAPVGDGEWDIDWQIAAYAIAPDSDKASMMAVGVVIDAADNQRALDNVFPPKDLRCDNLHSSALEKMGVTIWGATWTQAIRVGSNVFAADGAMPSALYVSMSPDIGLEHKDDYRDVVTGEAPDV